MLSVNHSMPDYCFVLPIGLDAMAMTGYFAKCAVKKALSCAISSPTNECAFPSVLVLLKKFFLHAQRQCLANAF